MRNKTLVLFALVAVSAFIVSLPTSHNQTSANAPQNVESLHTVNESIKADKLETHKNKIDKDKIRESEKPSRSNNREKSSESNVEANKAFAKSYMESKYSWDKDQHSCLVNLWNRESGWKHTADNPNSSAYGIPQSLPGSKMASAGADWRTNPETQIKWGLKYIKHRYETPCGAWNAFKQKGWY
jgi:hypothetical protein